MIDIPVFLDRRTQPKEPAMTTPTPAKAPKKKRADYYIARVDIKIPLDMNNADSLAQAIKATQAIKDTLPPGSECTVYGTLGKA